MRLFLIITSLFLIEYLPAQKIKTKTICLMPSELQETSGLIVGLNNTIWTHNDSGGKPILYQINTKGRIIRKVLVSNAQNKDWEELTEDRNGNVYIGDFGNNTNQRKDLCIYKIPHPDSLHKDTISAVKICFSYKDQKAFPPPITQRNFDMEAMVSYRDTLWLFSKNRSKPYNGYCKIYALPQKEGNYIAQLKDSIYLGGKHPKFSWITGACINYGEDTLLLLSHKKAWIITQFKNKKWSTATIKRTKTNHCFSQKEAITYSKKGQLYISNEKYYFLRSKWHIAKIKQKNQ